MALNKYFLSEEKPKLVHKKLNQLIQEAIIEDVGKGDITTKLIIPEHKYIKAILLAKENCVICGLEVAEMVFKNIDKKIKFRPFVKEGSEIKKGKIIARISGPATSILTSERVALNLLSMLSGIATKTKKYLKRIRPYKVKITTTRKTIPHLRELQNYAVRVGGGYSHRRRLDEMILVKDNHLKVIGGYRNLSKVTRNYRVELEVKNLRELKEALRLKPDIIMLDNMTIKDIKRAVQMRNNLTPKLEASGGISLKDVRKIAACGVDMLSVGELTHSLKSIDISLEVL